MMRPACALETIRQLAGLSSVKMQLGLRTFWASTDFDAVGGRPVNAHPSYSVGPAANHDATLVLRWRRHERAESKSGVRDGRRVGDERLSLDV
jgi:hypothetical protein